MSSRPSPRTERWARTSRTLPVGEQTLFSRQEGTQGLEALIVLILQERGSGLREQGAAIGIAQDLAEFLDPVQEPVAQLFGRRIAREQQLCQVTGAADGRRRLARVDRVPQPQDTCIGRLDRQAHAAVAILDDRAIDEHAFLRSELENEPAHVGPPWSARPRITAVLTSINGATDAPSRRTAPL